MARDRKRLLSVLPAALLVGQSYCSLCRTEHADCEAAVWHADVVVSKDSVYGHFVIQRLRRAQLFEMACCFSPLMTLLILRRSAVLRCCSTSRRSPCCLSQERIRHSGRAFKYGVDSIDYVELDLCLRPWQRIHKEPWRSRRYFLQHGRRLFVKNTPGIDV